MRLIDGEWLAGELFKHHVHDEDDLEPMVYLSDAQNLIATAPTIDAIPMWWITEKFLDVLNKDKELSKAAWLVRKAWQKEQEANDGTN